MTRRPNKRNVKRKLDDLDPTGPAADYGGIWCSVNHPGERYEPDRDPAPDDLVVEINHAIVPKAECYEDLNDS